MSIFRLECRHFVLLLLFFFFFLVHHIFANASKRFLNLSPFGRVKIFRDQEPLLWTPERGERALACLIIKTWDLLILFVGNLKN